MLTAYDELPYPGQPFVQTHPDHLATLATLFGMTPAPVERCRVLELGCGDGANLVPMALGLPESSFVGVDLTSTAIATGQALVKGLRLGNIALDQLDLMDIPPDFGAFDYIIAHGLYSWAPPAARDKILAICQENLSPHGVAFISYNTYPGGHFRDAIRAMMRFHVRNTSGLAERISQARELLEFLAASQPDSDADAVFLQSELQSFLERQPAHFYHDELGEINARFYFYQFIEEAARHCLQYLAEAQLLSMQTGALGPQVSETVRTLSRGDLIVQEQYLDFLKLRKFRQTLLCRQEALLDRVPKPERLATFYLASSGRPASPQPDLSSTAAEQFQFPKGGSMSTNHPLAKAALMHLGQVWPQSVPFPELVSVARSCAGRGPAETGDSLEQDSRWLSDMALKLYAANFIELHVHPPRFAARASERPVASPLARLQAREGDTVTNLRHGSVRIEDELCRNLLLLLDGARDRAALLRDLAEWAQPDQIRADKLEENLARLARLALLVA